jgi:hypothetical protein
MGRRGRYKSILSKKADDRRFPHRVDITVPPDGLGRRLDAMLVWCRENLEAGDWAKHGHSEHVPPSLPSHIARFYFAEAGTAEAFRRRWG